MENSITVLGETVGEENSAGSQRLNTRRNRFMRRNHFGSRISLPLWGRSRDATMKQRTSIKPPFHTVFKNLTPSLLAVMGVKYQAISEDPSKKFAPHIWSFLMTIFLYFLMLLKFKQSRNRRNRYSKIFNRVALAAGVVSCLSLVSLIPPHFHGVIVLYASWALFVIITALPVFQCIYNGVLAGIRTVLNILVDLARNLFTGSIFSQQPPSQETGSSV